MRSLHARASPVTDIGINGALAPRGVQPSLAVLQGEQTQLIVAVMVDLGQLGVVVPKEHTAIAVFCRDRERYLEKAFAVRELGAHRLAIDQEHLCQPAAVAVTDSPAQLHLVLGAVRDARAVAFVGHRYFDGAAGLGLAAKRSPVGP